MTTTRWIAVVGITGLLVMSGCSSDDPPGVTLPDKTDAAEAALENVLDEIVEPLFGLTEFIVDQLLDAPPPFAEGLECPDTEDACTGGSLTCDLGGGGISLDFDADGCGVLYEEEAHSLDGSISITPGLSLLLALTGVSIDGGPRLNGTMTLSEATCSTDVNVQASDGTLMAGTIIGCGEDPSPNSDLFITIVSSIGTFFVNVDFDGSGTATAIVSEGSSPFASCSINLDSLNVNCSDI